MTTGGVVSEYLDDFGVNSRCRGNLFVTRRTDNWTSKNTYVSFFPFYFFFFFFFSHVFRFMNTEFESQDRILICVVDISWTMLERTTRAFLLVGLLACRVNSSFHFRTGRNNSGRENIFLVCLALNNVQNWSTKGPAQGSRFNLREIFVRCGGWAPCSATQRARTGINKGFFARLDSLINVAADPQLEGSREFRKTRFCTTVLAFKSKLRAPRLPAPLARIYTTMRGRTLKTPRIPGLRSERGGKSSGDVGRKRKRNGES